MSSPNTSMIHPLPFVIRSPHQSHSQGSRSSDGGRPSSAHSFTHHPFATATGPATPFHSASPMTAPRSAPPQQATAMSNGNEYMDFEASNPEDSGFVAGGGDFEGIPASPEEMMAEDADAGGNESGGKDDGAAKGWMHGLGQGDREASAAVQMLEFGGQGNSLQTLSAPIPIPGSQNNTPTAPHAFVTSAARGEMPPPNTPSRVAARSESGSPANLMQMPADRVAAMESPTQSSIAASGPRPLPTSPFANAAPYSSGFNPQQQGTRFRGKSMSFIGNANQQSGMPFVNVMPNASGAMQSMAGSDMNNSGSLGGSLPRPISQGGSVQDQSYQTVPGGWEIRPPPLSSSLSSVSATTPESGAIFSANHFDDHRTPHTASSHGPSSSLDSLNTSSSSFFGHNVPGGEYFHGKGMNDMGHSYEMKTASGHIQHISFPNGQSHGQHFSTIPEHRSDFNQLRSGLGAFSLQGHGHEQHEDIKPTLPQSMPNYLWRGPPTGVGMVSSEHYDPHQPGADSALGFVPSKSPRKHVCKVCNKKFNRPSSLQTHMSVHTGAKPYQCSKIDCGRRFSVSSNLRRHQRTHEARQQKRMEAMRNNLRQADSDGFDDMNEQDELDDDERRSPTTFRQDMPQSQLQFGEYQPQMEYGSNQFGQGLSSSPGLNNGPQTPQRFTINGSQLGNAGLSSSNYHGLTRSSQNAPVQRSLMLGPGTSQMHQPVMGSLSPFTNKGNGVRMGTSAFGNGGSGSGRSVFTQQPLHTPRPLPSGV